MGGIFFYQHISWYTPIGGSKEELISEAKELIRAVSSPLVTVETCRIDGRAPQDWLITEDFALAKEMDMRGVGYLGPRGGRYELNVGKCAKDFDSVDDLVAFARGRWS